MTNFDHLQALRNYAMTHNNKVDFYHKKEFQELADNYRLSLPKKDQGENFISVLKVLGVIAIIIIWFFL